MKIMKTCLTRVKAWQIVNNFIDPDKMYHLHEKHLAKIEILWYNSISFVLRNGMYPVYVIM